MAKSKKWMKNAIKKAKGKSEDKAKPEASSAAKKPRGERWYGKKD